MSDHNEDEDLNFSELIGNLLTSHNEDENDNNKSQTDEIIQDKGEEETLHSQDKDHHDVELPDLEDDDVGEADFVPDFTSVVSNALQGITTEEDNSGNANDNQGIDEQQQSEWAHILQQGLLQDDDQNGMSESQLDDEILDQDDENLRRAILESLQGLNNTPTIETTNKSTLDDEIPQVEIIRKSTKKSSKKSSKKKQIKEKLTTTTTNDKATDDKQSKKKKTRKEKGKSKAKSTTTNDDDHLIEIDDVIRGIMRQNEEEQEEEEEEGKIDESSISNDNNEAETKALVEATLKAFEKQLMTSETTSAPKKTRKIVPIPKRPTPRPKPKTSVPKKSTKLYIPPIPTPFIGHKDLNYEIPVSTFYPQPKKPTHPTTSTSTTTIATKKKKAKKPKATSKSPIKKILPSATENDDFQDDDFSKVLAEMVNQVVETSLSEQITEEKEKGEEHVTEKETPKPVEEPTSKRIEKEPTHEENEKEESTVDHAWEIPFTAGMESQEIEPEKEKSTEEEEEDNEEPFDLNQIMKNAMTLAFETKIEQEESEPDEEEEEEEKEKAKTEELAKSETPQIAKELVESEKLVTLEKPEETELVTEVTKISKPDKLEKVKKTTKAKKVPKAKRPETEKLKKPKKVKITAPKLPKKKPVEVAPRKKYDTIIIDSFQKKLPGNSFNDVANSIRKLNAQSKGKIDKNREIIIRNVEVEKRFSKLKNGISMKPQSPQVIFKKKFSLIAEAAANEARRLHREKNRQLRIKLKEEREKIKEAKKVQKELDQAKEDAEQKELEELVAKGPPYPADLRLTKKGVPKKPYRRYSPEELALRAQLEEDTYGEIEDRLRTLNYNKNNSTTVRKSSLFNFIKQNVVLNDTNLSNIEDVLKKIGLPSSYFDHLVSPAGTLGYSFEEIANELKVPNENKFNPSTKTIVHKERFLFHTPWSLPDHPPIALPMARRGIINRISKSRSNTLQDDSAFMAVTRKLIPTILNPIINTLKTAAKKRIADGASPEEATRHLLTIINHTKKSIAQVIANARQRQLREPLAKIKQEEANNSTAHPSQSPINLHRIPLLSSMNHNKRKLSQVDAEPKSENLLKTLPLIPLSKKAKTDDQPSSDVIVIHDEAEKPKESPTSPIVISDETEEHVKQVSVSQPTAVKDSNMSEVPVIQDNLEATEKESATNHSVNSEVSTKKSTVTDLGTAVALNNESDSTNGSSGIVLDPSEEQNSAKDSTNVKSSEENSTKAIDSAIDILNSNTDNVITSDLSGNQSEISSVTSSTDLVTQGTTGNKVNSTAITQLPVNIDDSNASNENLVSSEISKSNEDAVSKVEEPKTGLHIPLLVKNFTKSLASGDSPNNQLLVEKPAVGEEITSNNLLNANNPTGSSIEKLADSPNNRQDDRSVTEINDKSESISEDTQINFESNPVKIKTENNPDILKKIPITSHPSVPASTPANGPVKVESMVKSLVAKQLQDSSEDGDQILPDGITNLITSTLTNLIPEIQNDFINEEKRKRRTGPNSVFNFDGIVPPPLVRNTLVIPRPPRSPSIRKTPIAKKPKKEKRMFQPLYTFEIPDFSNVVGKKNIFQKKLKEFLTAEEFDNLRKDISTERKRRWRDANAIQNKINELRMRVKKRAIKAFGVEDTEEKLEWINSTFKQKSDEAGFTDFLKQKSNSPEKKEASPISDSDILNMIAINLNKLDVARKIESSLAQEPRDVTGPKLKKRKLNKDNSSSDLSHIEIATSVSSNL